MTPQQEQALADFQKMIDKLCVKKINLMKEVDDINQTIIFPTARRQHVKRRMNTTTATYSIQVTTPGDIDLSKGLQQNQRHRKVQKHRTISYQNG